MTNEMTRTGMPKQRGASLIELIMFIVIVSVALAGILLVMNVTTRGSADPLIHKQALAIAESILEEVELMPFTFCDPDDANATTATGPGFGVGECAASSEDTIIGPEGEGRYAVPQFDNVSDYNGCQMNTGPANGCTGGGGIRDITDNPIGPATGYMASVVITRAGTALGLLADADALRIAVTVIGPGGASVTVDGIRTRYAPRAVP